MKSVLKSNTESPEMFLGFGKLEPNMQDKVRQEEAKLTLAADRIEVSTMEMGEHLFNIRKILDSGRSRVFNKFLLSWVRNRKRPISRATAYRYIEEYKVAHSRVAKPVLEMALQRGTKLTAETLTNNPPPKTEDKTKIARYLDNLRNMRVEVIKSPDTITKEIVNFARSRLATIANGKTKMAIMRTVVGMLMATVGISEQSFTPVAVPESFKAKRGRPARKVA
jgi:hypothetical protein